MSSSLTVDNPEVARQAADEFRSVHTTIRQEVSRMMVGQDATVDGVLAALFAAGTGEWMLTWNTPPIEV